MKNELRKIINKYLKGRTSSTENEIVNQLYDSLKSDEFEFDKFSCEEKDNLETRMFERIQSSIQTKQHTVISKTSYLKWAAILIIPLLITGLYFAKLNMSSDEDLLLSEPGNFTANLITTSGKSYSLSSAVDLTKLQAEGLYEDVSEEGETIVMHEIQTPKGAFYQLILPDSSLVWLNAASTIRFPSRFDEHKREVFLSGEGYFEIKHNSSAPFYVKSEHQTTKVLGTKFNINAYAGQESDLITLIEGSVEARSLKHEKLIMTPGYQAKIGASIRYEKVDQAGDYAAWRSGDFYFDNYPMTEVLRMLGRWYNIEVDETSIPNNRINGLIPRNLLLKDVLALIETTSGVTISVVNSKLKVVEKKNQHK